MTKGHTPMHAGVLSGVIAGIIFGAMMGMMGMLPMVAMLIKSESAFAGFIVHIIFSAIIGAIFAHFFHKKVKTRLNGVLYGILYGAIWWILGPLIIMPLWMGAGIMLTSAGGIAGALPSLWGHLIYGFLLGLIYDFVVLKG